MQRISDTENDLNILNKRALFTLYKNLINVLIIAKLLHIIRQ